MHLVYIMISISRMKRRKWGEDKEEGEKSKRKTRVGKKRVSTGEGRVSRGERGEGRYTYFRCSCCEIAAH